MQKLEAHWNGEHWDLCKSFCAVIDDRFINFIDKILIYRPNSSSTELYLKSIRVNLKLKEKKNGFSMILWSMAAILISIKKRSNHIIFFPSWSLHQLHKIAIFIENSNEMKSRVINFTVIINNSLILCHWFCYSGQLKEINSEKLTKK